MSMSICADLCSHQEQAGCCEWHVDSDLCYFSAGEERTDANSDRYAFVCAATQAAIQHEGENCWGQCEGKGGTCPWCGTGVCCHSSGIHAADPAECNGVTHNFGDFHACVKKATRTKTTTENALPTTTAR